MCKAFHAGTQVHLIKLPLGVGRFALDHKMCGKGWTYVVLVGAGNKDRYLLPSTVALFVESLNRRFSGLVDGSLRVLPLRSEATLVLAGSAFVDLPDVFATMTFGTAPFDDCALRPMAKTESFKCAAPPPLQVVSVTTVPPPAADTGVGLRLDLSRTGIGKRKHVVSTSDTVSLRFSWDSLICHQYIMKVLQRSETYCADQLSLQSQADLLCLPVLVVSTLNLQMAIRDNPDTLGALNKVGCTVEKLDSSIHSILLALDMYEKAIKEVASIAVAFNDFAATGSDVDSENERMQTAATYLATPLAALPRAVENILGGLQPGASGRASGRASGSGSASCPDMDGLVAQIRATAFGSGGRGRGS